MENKQDAINLHLYRITAIDRFGESVQFTIRFRDMQLVDDYLETQTNFQRWGIEYIPEPLATNSLLYRQHAHKLHYGERSDKRNKRFDSDYYRHLLATYHIDNPDIPLKSVQAWLRQKLSDCQQYE